jgi:FKBP-type peptidyl-prolyl cis-trans isomerase
MMKFLIGFLMFCSAGQCIAQDSSEVANLNWDSRYKGIRVIKLVENGSGMSLKNMEGKATQVKYICFHESGTVIEDVSWKQGKPLLYSEKTIPRFIDGFSKGVAKFKEGEKGYIWIPKKLGYGKDNMGNELLSGNLVYYIEVLEKNPGKK